MKEIKTRKAYERPSMRVVVMQHRTHLLQASGERSPYGSPEKWNWE